jgi:tRNA(adenine34) deaminase
MEQAYEQAVQAQLSGEVPVGAVLVDADNQLLSRNHNRVIHQNDPTAHAEMLVLRDAAKLCSNHRLEGCTLYVTLEPCCMCAGALVHARISRVVFSCRDFKAGAAGSVCNLLRGYPLNHRIQIDEGFLQTECSTLLSHFFEARR